MSSSSEEKYDFTGTLLNKKYIAFHKLGEGAYAEVWLCMNITSLKFYAIKIHGDEDYDVGMDEIEIFKKINKCSCEYINTLIEHFIFKDPEYVNDKYVCMVFDLMIGSLYDIIRLGKYSKGLPSATITSILKQLCIAIDVITTKCKIVHSDIKPDNILVCGVSNKVQEIIDLVLSSKTLLGLIKKNKNWSEIKKQVKKLNFSDIIKKYDKYATDDHTTINFVDQKYIDNIKIKLSDFGTYQEIKSLDYGVQTRYYRPPEIILQYEYNENCDMWSVGCTMYELLTGKVLFDPIKSAGCSTDRVHIFLMVSLLGPIPNSLLEQATKRFEIFKHNGMIKGFDSIKFANITDNIPNIDDNKKIIDIIFNLLDYDPFKRYTAKQVLNELQKV